jgi:hypothetical protein
MDTNKLQNTPRAVRLEGSSAYITLACGAEALIDAEDAYRVSYYDWHLCNGYAARSVTTLVEEPGPPLRYSMVGSSLVAQPARILVRKQRTVLLHRWLINAPDGYPVDHKNRIPLDNRKQNLRIRTNAENARNRSLSEANTNAENARNRPLSAANTSGFKGVTAVASKKGTRYVANIGHNSKTIYLGRYDTPEEAHTAYCDAASALHGRFANLG